MHQSGLLDEIDIHLVPVLLGKGVRLFENLGTKPVELECTGVTADTGVVHLRYKIVK